MLRTPSDTRMLNACLSETLHKGLRRLACHHSRTVVATLEICLIDYLTDNPVRIGVDTARMTGRGWSYRVSASVFDRVTTAVKMRNTSPSDLCRKAIAYSLTKTLGSTEWSWNRDALDKFVDEAQPQLFSDPVRITGPQAGSEVQVVEEPVTDVRTLRGLVTTQAQLISYLTKKLHELGQEV